MSWDAWLDDGKGAFPFGRPIRWLVAAVRRRGGAVHDLRARGGRARARRSCERLPPPAATASCRAAAAGASSRRARFAELQATLARALRAARRPRRASARIDEGWRGRPRAARSRRPRPARRVARPRRVPDGRGRAVPAEFRGLPARGARDRAGAPPEVHPARRGRDGRRASRPSRNGDGAAGAAIVRGMERVVVARLRDAAFFFAEDRKRPLADASADLAGRHVPPEARDLQGQGRRAWSRSWRRWRRRGLLAGESSRPPRGRGAAAPRPTSTTLMVREFPELQGVMGGIYLRAAAGANRPRWRRPCAGTTTRSSVEAEAAPAGSVRRPDAARACSRRCRSPTSSTRWPATSASARSPPGSRDPYGLRRAGQGAVRVVLDFWRPKPARSRPSLDGAGGGGVRRATARSSSRRDASREERLELSCSTASRYVLTARGFPADEVEAVARAPDPDALADPHEACVRARGPAARPRARRPRTSRRLAEAFKRAKNIVAQAAPGRGRGPGAVRGRRRARALRGDRAPRPGRRGLRGAPARAGGRCARRSTASSTTCW